MTNYIINPETNHKVNLSKKKGLDILNNYLKVLEVGKGEKYIINPETNHRVKISSKKGAKILNNYMMILEESH